MPSKKAIIFGISGQDGSLLAKLLLKKNYQVIGQTRKISNTNLVNLDKLGIKKDIEFKELDLENLNRLIDFLEEHNADEIYNLSGQSSVGFSINEPRETFLSQSLAHINIIEAARILKLSSKIFNASSGDCFGETSAGPANEDTPFNLRSPYAFSKASSYWSSAVYRDTYNLKISTGFMFNHESDLRSDKFVTKKIINGAIQIANGKKDKLILGNVSIERDWGYAEEYVEAMWRILQLNDPEDFVIATGVKRSLLDFVATAFANFDLDYTQYVFYDNEFLRPNEMKVNYGDPSKANRLLNWKPKVNLEKMIKILIDKETISIKQNDL
jgi:GDPmannose 4,6-dehydratase